MTIDREAFEFWLADMEDAIERFCLSLPAEVRERLDFTPESLDVIEDWLLRRYASVQEMIAASESLVVDGGARYVGETFRRAIGGIWDIRLDDPKYAFYGKPQLTGFSRRPTPVCPLLLTTATADRRTGRFLRGVLESYLRDKEREKARR